MKNKLENIKLKKLSTKRPVSSGAEKWLGKPIKVLDHGFVYLVDYMGNDLSIEQAARVSYGGGTRAVTQTEGLIRYLRRHDHTTPFEMIEVKLHAKMPFFVARQWVRHRTASINEMSARYSVLDKEFYVPELKDLAVQAKNNKQGRGEAVSLKQAKKIRELIENESEEAYLQYELLLNDDGEGSPKDLDKPMLARELARMGLTLNFYTQWYWKVNLHNLMHFLKLRMDPHAQLEIRVYADAIAEIIKDAFPIAWKAFEDYELEAKKFTKPELEILEKLLEKVSLSEEEVRTVAEKSGITNKREISEMVEKFKSLKITN